MAKLVLTDAYIKVGAVNLSDHCSSIEIKDEADAVDPSRDHQGRVGGPSTT